MIAAEAHTPLDRVRRKLEETFGEFELPTRTRPRRPSPRSRRRGGGDRPHALGRDRGAPPRRDRVPGGRREEPSVRAIEPHALERELPCWYVHTWDRTRDAQRSFRLDRMRARPPAGRDVRAAARPRAREAPATSAPPACSSARRSRPGASSAAHARSRTGPRSRRCATGASSGSSARSCPTAAQAVVVEPDRAARRQSPTARGRSPKRSASAGARRLRRLTGKPHGERRAVAFPGVRPRASRRAPR